MDSKGTGSAGDAQVISSDDVGDLSEIDIRKAAIEAADAAVDAAEAKVKRQKEHLEGANDALSEAREARKGI